MEGFNFVNMGANAGAKPGGDSQGDQEQLPIEIIDEKTGEVIKV